MMNNQSFVLNFFKSSDKDYNVKLLSNYFGIDSFEVFKELMKYYKEKYDEIEFINKFRIDLNKEFYKSIYITCRHAMTTNDNLEYMKKNGLLNLKQMLDNNSPLGKFLLENKIEFDVDSKKIYFNNIGYDILDYNEKCNSCIFHSYKCISLLSKKPDLIHCDYRKKLFLLHNKLYYDKCETEVFIDGSLEDIYKYRTIRKAPEILLTIDEVIKQYDNKIGCLTDKWSNRTNSKYFILEFDVDIKLVERICTKEYYEDYYEIKDFLNKFGYDQDDYENDTISITFYKNLYVLKKLISKVIWGNFKEYAQMLPDTIINFKNIQIIRQHMIDYEAPEEGK
jgi:hypothetical protein